MPYEMSNKEFSKKDTIFIAACGLASVLPTMRQASKYRLQKGTAYSFRNAARSGQRKPVEPVEQKEE